MIRNNICMNCHPGGCAAFVRSWIGRMAETAPSLASAAIAADRTPPKAVLVLGGSTGYGLASRVAAAWGFGASTVSVSFERVPDEKRPGTPGWYDTEAFDREAAAAGLVARSFNADAFADSTRETVIACAKELHLAFDLVVYSLASPVRIDPKTGTMYRSVLKPLGKPYSGINVDVWTGSLSTATIEPATPTEAEGTVKVMGGEDWRLWIDALRDASVLAKGAATVAYSYIGPEHSWPLYRSGTIGAAKEHLERTAAAIRASLSPLGGSAWVSVNKALVTRASSVIPIIPLYVSALYKVMKERGVHEDCLDQIVRLYRDRLYAAPPVPTDAAGRIRLDDLEMREDVQAETTRRLRAVDASNSGALIDLDGFRADFLQAHGFEVPGVDYSAD
ncbi:MAG: trans-2-enoyl-CoA reductase family protein [Spirochaetes bacterium]|nr:trans-2-enoyl-CoA reductase family protein [Spirochaetota bacterium]